MNSRYLKVLIWGIFLGGPAVSRAVAAHDAIACPIVIVPGQSLGPIHLGMSADALQSLGLPVRAMETPGFINVGPFKVMSQSGKVSQVWIDDIRQAPDCLRYQSEKVPNTIPRQALLQRLGAFRPIKGVKGGQFAQSDSGVKIGWNFDGTDSHLQLRIIPAVLRNTPSAD